VKFISKVISITGKWTETPFGPVPNRCLDDNGMLDRLLDLCVRSAIKIDRLVDLRRVDPYKSPVQRPSNHLDGLLWDLTSDLKDKCGLSSEVGYLLMDVELSNDQNIVDELTIKAIWKYKGYIQLAPEKDVIFRINAKSL
jgi:hypothetical protein